MFKCIQSRVLKSCPKVIDVMSAVLSALIIVFSISPSNANAQGSAEMLAPADVSGFSLACAEMAEGGKVKIILSREEYRVEKIKFDATAKATSRDVDEKKDGDDAKDDEVRMVEQTYTVSIPYTEEVEVDGKIVNVTRMRLETRTRTVPIRVGGNKNTKIATFTVRVPYAETIQDRDGNTVQITSYRKETRTLTIEEDEEVVSTLKPIEAVLDPAQLKYYDLAGNELSAEDALDRLTERTAVVILAEDKPLGQFFQKLMRPETIMIFDSERWIERNLAEPKN